MSTLFPLLFSPLRIGPALLKNRIMSTGHDTVLPEDGRVSPALVAYHRARARGGVGLIVLQVSGVHETARYTSRALMATDDSCVPGYRQLAEAVHAEGCKLFAQLFHPGREIMESADGLLSVAYAPSATPSERFHVQPRALSREMIDDIIAGYGAAARRLRAAGVDGAEIVASHGYLPAQFLNPQVNRRQDGYGGDDAGRLRFLREAVAAARAGGGPGFVVGLRISAGEEEGEGMDAELALAATRALESELDYVSLVAGSSATLGAAIHIAPPMALPAAYLAAQAARFKRALSIPVLLAGRINQPQEAEQLLAGGQADGCGMTRALICDPELPAKAEQGRHDDIRACIGCNQACIGRFHRGLPISCIQHPQSGRELEYGELRPAAAPRRVLVAGGGPAGMKAAVIAAQRGHQVSLYEAGPQLGGQALLAQLLPGRAEFGGLITNLERELQLAGVEVRRNVRVDRELVRRLAPDAVVVATGARPRWPALEGGGAMQVLDAWQVLRGEAVRGGKVLVADWRCDWIGPGIALRLAAAGHQVRLAVNGTHAGEALQMYVRDHLAGQLQRAGVAVTPYARLYGHDDDSVYLLHTASEEAMVESDVDCLVLCQGHQAEDGLLEELSGCGAELHAIGDCLAPRTAEEAIYEGMRLGWRL
ncbi:oxidoreductase [Chromobacterium haemolyticum]|uniref:oxidoreductase n=1 Tax=Chromobacterium haemolyticum TaxID=394935 RepID=UPI0009DA3B14|nr:FAD-dependent oxidoreductase [Chromobacterium haemolyticum]OQS38168.1 oxidoreductase [Chromobacterium haemolyticum]